jgi:hypothetical protein
VFRWFLLLLGLVCLYWAYQHGVQRGDDVSTRLPTAGEPAPTLAPGPRLGGGLNPFVSESDIDAPPQRPKAP